MTGQRGAPGTPARDKEMREARGGGGVQKSIAAGTGRGLGVDLKPKPVCEAEKTSLKDPVSEDVLEGENALGGEDALAGEDALRSRPN